MAAGRYLLLIERAAAVGRQQIEASLGGPVTPLEGWWLASDVSRMPDPAEARWRVSRASRLAGGLGVGGVTTRGCSEIDVFRAGERLLVFELDFEGLSESNLLEILGQIGDSPEVRDPEDPDPLDPDRLAPTRPVPAEVLNLLDFDDEVQSRLRAGAAPRDALRRVVADRAAAIEAAFESAPGRVDRKALVEILAGEAGVDDEPSTPFYNLPDLLEAAGVEGLVRRLVDDRLGGLPGESGIRVDAGCPLSCALPILVLVGLATVGGVAGHRWGGGLGLTFGALLGLLVAYVLTTLLMTWWHDRPGDEGPGLPDVDPLTRQDVLASLEPEAVPWSRRLVADWSEVSSRLGSRPLDDPRGVWEATFHSREAPHVAFLLQGPDVESVRMAAARVADLRLRWLASEGVPESAEALRSEYRQWMKEMCPP